MYWVSVFTEAGIFAILALGLDVVWGWSGDFDLAFYGYLAIGSYMTMGLAIGKPTPPVEYIKVSGGIFKDMLIHDFDIFRWILADEAATIFATGSCLTDPAIEKAGDIDATAVTIRTRKGRLAQINTLRRAAYGYDQRFEVIGSKGMLQAGNHRPTEVVAWNAESVGADKPEHFFLERYRAAYAAEMAHFIDAVGHGQPVRTSIDDGVKALELADAATRAWRDKRIIDL